MYQGAPATSDQRSSRKKTENSGKEMIQEMKLFIPELKDMNFQVQKPQCPAQWMKNGLCGGTVCSWAEHQGQREDLKSYQKNK